MNGENGNRQLNQMAMHCRPRLSTIALFLSKWNLEENQNGSRFLAKGTPAEETEVIAGSTLCFLAGAPLAIPCTFTKWYDRLEVVFWYSNETPQSTPLLSSYWHTALPSLFLKCSHTQEDMKNQHCKEAVRKANTINWRAGNWSINCGVLIG